MKLAALLLLTAGLFLEVTVTTIPFILLVLLCFAVVAKGSWVFIYAFVFGLILDILSFKTIGSSSIFFLVFLCLVFLYQRRFEIATNYFVLISTFLGSFFYLLLSSGTGNIILEPVLSAIIGLGLFRLLLRIDKTK